MSDNTLTGLHADTIDQVIASLDRVVDWSKQNRMREGYFAALYRKVTIKVKEGIEQGHFDDGPRMAHFDVIFANRYLDALEAHLFSQSVTQVWHQAFTLGEQSSPVVLQHLMIGMNAHINFDLGIAAAQTVPPTQLLSLKPDFDKINGLLSSLVDEVQGDLEAIWPAFGWLDKIAGQTDEKIADHSMTFSRDRAWSFAQAYAHAADRQRVLDDMDEKIHKLGRWVVTPPFFLRLKLLAIRATERGSVEEKIAILE